VNLSDQILLCIPDSALVSGRKRFAYAAAALFNEQLDHRGAAEALHPSSSDDEGASMGRLITELDAQVHDMQQSLAGEELLVRSSATEAMLPLS
jgi:hypothetical protein